MAGTKIIKKRIASVKNTCKITRTMEMVSTAKSKKIVDRVTASTPYRKKIVSLLHSLQETGVVYNSPYTEKAPSIKNLALIVISANRGLCGGYNSNVLRLAYERYQKLREEDISCDLFVLGKKGVSFFKFLKIPMKENYTHIEDTFQYEDSETLLMPFLKSFSQKEYDAIEIVSTVYHSSSRQEAELIPFLPFLSESLENKKPDNFSSTSALADNYSFSPDAAIILKKLIPLSIKTKFYNIFLGAMASEQIARRIAMKNATDAAGDMLKNLTRSYNRARQASITQELAEIVAGADAI